MQRIIKSLLAATAGLALSIAPAHARIESNTDELLTLLSETGVRVTINDPDHCGIGYHATYQHRGLNRQMNLCPGSSVDAIDHNAVRHETWHAIQHCVNSARGTDMYTPVQTDIDMLVDAVNQHLSVETVNFIKANYTEQELLLEFEAFVIAEVGTATELIEIYNEVCMSNW